MSSLTDNIKKLGKAAVAIPSGLLEAGSLVLGSWYRSQGMTKQNSGSAMTPYDTGKDGIYVQNDNGVQVFSGGKNTNEGFTFTQLKSPIEVYQKICSLAITLGIKITKTAAEVADVDENSALGKFLKAMAKAFGWVGSTMKELADWLTGAIAWQDITLDDDGKAYPTEHSTSLGHAARAAYDSGLILPAPGVRGGYSFIQGDNALKVVSFPTFSEIKPMLQYSEASSLDKCEAAWKRDMEEQWDIIGVVGHGNDAAGHIGGYDVTISDSVEEEASRILSDYMEKTTEADFIAQLNTNGRIIAIKKDAVLDSYGLAVKSMILSGLIAGEWSFSSGAQVMSTLMYSPTSDEWYETGYGNNVPINEIEYGGSFAIQYKDSTGSLVSSPWVVGTIDEWGGEMHLTTYDSPTTVGVNRYILSLASYVVTTEGSKTSDGSEALRIHRIISAFQSMTAGATGMIQTSDGVEDATGDGDSIGRDESADDYLKRVGARSISNSNIDSKTGEFTGTSSYVSGISTTGTRADVLNPSDVLTDTDASAALERGVAIARTATGAETITKTLPQPQPVPVLSPDEIINKIPASDANTGLYILYSPSLSQLQNFAKWLWADDVITNIKKVVQDPIQAIISLHRVYIEPTTGEDVNIILGNVQSDVSAPVCSSRYVRQNMGSVKIPFYNNNFMDFSGITLDIWLPFIGFKRLDTSVCMGQSLTLVYTLDLLTGALTATIANRAGIIYVFSGQMADAIPLSASDFSRIYSGLIGAATGAALGGISGGATGALTAGASGVAGLTGQIQTPIEKTAASGSMGALAPKTPYIVEQIVQTYNPYQYRYNTGIPENAVVNLVSSTGFTQADGLRGDTGDMTADELNELRLLFKNGVYIPYFDQSSDSWVYTNGKHVEKIYIVTPSPTAAETTKRPVDGGDSPYYSD